MDLEELLAKVTKYDDDRCNCEGCQVVYVRDLRIGGDAGRCKCGCYSWQTNENKEQGK